MRKVVALCMSAILMTSSVFASFPDVSDTFWGKDVITKWTDLDIVKGDNVGNFRPNDNRFIGPGFLGPFLLGGITGGLLAPNFGPRPYPVYRPYPPYPPYPIYY